MLSKSDQTVAHDAWVRIIEDMPLRKVQSCWSNLKKFEFLQIWNRDDPHKLGFKWEYKDEKAFVQCQLCLYSVRPKNEGETNSCGKRTGIAWSKIFPVL